MENIGETLVGDYLRVVLGCDFVNFNVHTKDTQGEIDVVGINVYTKTVYLCEVAIHIHGLHYNKNGQSNNVQKFIDKFNRNIEYSTKNFDGYNCVHMLWSPIIRKKQVAELEFIKKHVQENHQTSIVVFCNKSFSDALQSLRNHARENSEAMKSPVMRFLQIEEWLAIHKSKSKTFETEV